MKHDTASAERKQPQLEQLEAMQQALSQAETLDDFFGKEGIFARLFADTVEAMLEAEMTEHLGYERYESKGRNSGNSPIDDDSIFLQSSKTGSAIYRLFLTTRHSVYTLDLTNPTTKIHMLICRDSLLPIMLLVSPANANDAPWAPRLMRLAHMIFALPVEIVRADAAYYTKAILAFIIVVLGAVPKVVFNPRKAGKKGLVTLKWAANARKERGERGYIERFFAVLKRYYRLNQLQGSGLWYVYRHAFEVCFAVLLVAWLAQHLGRGDLLHSRSRIIAPC